MLSIGLGIQKCPPVELASYWKDLGRLLEGRGGHQLGLEGGMRWTLVSGKGKGSPHMERHIEACCLLITVPLPIGPPEAEEGPRAKSNGALSQQNSSPSLPHHSHQHHPPSSPLTPSLSPSPMRIYQFS